MSFLNPWFLLALSAISIPIIIHLFQFRRFRKVYFSNISFLEQISVETRRQARLKHLLVLLARILAIIFLVMAFSRPYIPLREGEEQYERNHVSVFVDNSFSMEAGPGIGNLLDRARQGAAEIVNMFSPTDRFQLLTNDFEARHQRFVSRDEFLSMLGEVNFSPSVRNISDVMARQSDLLYQEPDNARKLAFVLSDFQKNISQLDDLELDSVADFFFVPFQEFRPANLFIDSVWIDNPVRMAGQIISVQARIYNDSDQPLQNQPARLYVNDTQRAVATFDVGPFSHTDVSLNFSISNERLQRGYVEITDHPVTFDDRFFFSFNLSDDIPVLIIHQTAPNRFINALFGADTTFIVQNVNISSIDFSLFGRQNLIILDGINSPGSGLVAELNRYVRQGGNLLVFPSENADIPSYNDLFNTLETSPFRERSATTMRVTALNELHPVYSGVFERIPENLDLPVAEQYYVKDRQTRGRGQFLLQFQNGDNFFTATPVEQGNVFVSAVPASDSFSNFPRHAIFVPTVYNIALQSSAFYPLYYTINSAEFVTIRNYQPTAGQLFRIQSSQIDVIPEARNLNNNIQLILHGQIQNQGTYRLLSGEEILRFLAFNYDRRESYLQTFSRSELESAVAATGLSNIFLLEPGNVSFAKQIELLRGGRQLWKWFLLAGLIFLAIEVLLLRLLK